MVAFSPLGRGTLTSGIRSLNELAPEDARRGLPRFQPEAFAANRRLVERVESVACERGATVAQVALAWVLSEGVVPIPATRRMARLDENAGAAEIQLSEDERTRLADAVPVGAVVGSRDEIDAGVGVDR